jgi:hypothetical protein
MFFTYRFVCVWGGGGMIIAWVADYFDVEIICFCASVICVDPGSIDPMYT